MPSGLMINLFPSKESVRKTPNHEGSFFSKFTVHSAYSSSCRPVYDGVSPHWKEREKDRMCVVPAVRRGAAYAAFCGTGTGLPCAPPYKALRHSGIQVLHSPAARRVPRRVPCREPRREPRRVPRRAPPPPRRMLAAAPVRTTPNMWQP